MANPSINLLPVATITTATTIVGPEYLFGPRAVESLAVEGIFVYGSGGTTAKVFVQTSLDGGATWFDVLNLAFLLATASKLGSVSTAVALGTQGAAAGDGALADNSANQGVLGDRVRVKVITTGTYAGGTTIAVWASLRGFVR